MHSPRIRKLCLEDVPFAQSLRDIAGWNQTDADWERLIRYEPEGCFLVDVEGGPAGTATTTIHDGKVGWIGMVLVHPNHRRRGVATLLLQECINYLKPRTSCIKLDATPAGMNVYTKLGFVEESRLHRWEGHAAGVVPHPPERVDTSIELDTSVFGADRRKFLRTLAEGSSVKVTPEGKGYGMVREGSNAFYLGPVVAETPAIGETIISSLLAPEGADSIYWDIHAANPAAVALARSLGFEKQRELIRMRLGPGGFEGDLARQWAITGPETG